MVLDQDGREALGLARSLGDLGLAVPLRLGAQLGSACAGAGNDLVGPVSMYWSSGAPFSITAMVALSKPVLISTTH